MSDAIRPAERLRGAVDAIMNTAASGIDAALTRFVADVTASTAGRPAPAPEPPVRGDRLSEHFTLAELTATQHRNIDNTAPAEVVETLRDTARRMEAVRTLLGSRAISVSSGYRCPKLNKAVGGSKTSAHMTGHAVDFNCYGFGKPLAVCKAIAASDLEFDQLITEGTWAHISFDPRMRRQVLTMRGGKYTAGLS